MLQEQAVLGIISQGFPAKVTTEQLERWRGIFISFLASYNQ